MKYIYEPAYLFFSSLYICSFFKQDICLVILSQSIRLLLFETACISVRYLKRFTVLSNFQTTCTPTTLFSTVCIPLKCLKQLVVLLIFLKQPLYLTIFTQSMYLLILKHLTDMYTISLQCLEQPVYQLNVWNSLYIW